jgi:hypothetical protein
MKKIFPVSLLFLSLTICLQLSALLPTPVGLPQTMNIANQDVYIDVNHDGFGDFFVRFRSNPEGSFCEIYDPVAPGSPSPALGTPSVDYNKVLYEEESLGYYTTILNQGVPISSAGLWNDYASIFRKNNIPLPSPPPLASSYADGAFQGFIGIHYNIPSGGGMYYGWLPVQIDPNGQWVIIGPGGSGSAPGQSVLSGTGGSAVPIPLIASIFGFGLVGGGIFLKRRKK